MNKLIQELSLQAGIAANLSADVVERDKNKWIDLYSEKFARLIVQECIDIIAPYSVRMSRPGEEYLHPIQEIKQHFGVDP